MSKKDEALKLALNKAFQLGQRYWSWADSEYSSHWKKADAAKAEFDQLVQDTINAALAEQPAQQALDKMAENARELGLDYEPVWNNLPPNKDVEDAMRLKRLSQLAEQPARRTWVGLTDEEVHALWMTGEANISEEHHSVVAYEIEAKLREKNNG